LSARRLVVKGARNAGQDGCHDNSGVVALVGTAQLHTG
jgi:hypothetical protein